MVTMLIHNVIQQTNKQTPWYYLERDQYFTCPLFLDMAYKISDYPQQFQLKYGSLISVKKEIKQLIFSSPLR